MANRKQDNWLIVGLGNPGKEYATTWHNIGASFLQHIASRHEGEWRKEKDFHYLHCPDSLHFSNPTTLAIPSSFMNESGGAVKSALKKFTVNLDCLIVAHDDSDLLLGEARMEFGRGSAGHNGVRSIIHTLSNQDFWRLRIGIRKDNPARRVPAGEFVLTHIKGEDYGAIEEAFATALNAATKLISKE